MSYQRKQKRDLLTALGHIERFHRRRMILTGHVVVSLAIQLAIWVNWYSAYGARGVGFEGNFFESRFIISLTLLLFLLGHAVITRLAERKDRLVVQALQRYDMEEDVIDAHYNRLDDLAEDENAASNAAWGDEARQRSVR